MGGGEVFQGLIPRRIDVLLVIHYLRSSSLRGAIETNLDYLEYLDCKRGENTDVSL